MPVTNAVRRHSPAAAMATGGTRNTHANRLKRAVATTLWNVTSPAAPAARSPMVQAPHIVPTMIQPGFMSNIETSLTFEVALDSSYQPTIERAKRANSAPPSSRLRTHAWPVDPLQYLLGIRLDRNHTVPRAARRERSRQRKNGRTFDTGRCFTGGSGDRFAVSGSACIRLPPAQSFQIDQIVHLDRSDSAGFETGDGRLKPRGIFRSPQKVRSLVLSPIPGGSADGAGGIDPQCGGGRAVSCLCHRLALGGVVVRARRRRAVVERLRHSPTGCVPSSV